jgi:hypothetical protein
MTEAEWLEGAHPCDMLDCLRGRVSARKLRLFGCACCRHPSVSHYLPEKVTRHAVEVAERCAEGLATAAELAAAADAAEMRLPWLPSGRSSNPARLTRPSQAKRALLALMGEDTWTAAWDTARESLSLLGHVQRDLLYEIFGNPFRSGGIDPSWLRWNGACVERIARQIYDERNVQAMPLLGDALLDAGCDDEDLLAHLRGGGPHARGCWVIDLILGKT